MVGGWVFLLVLAHPGSPGQRAIKRSLLSLCCVTSSMCGSAWKTTASDEMPLISYTADVDASKSDGDARTNVLLNAGTSRDESSCLLVVASPLSSPVTSWWWHRLMATLRRGNLSELAAPVNTSAHSVVQTWVSWQLQWTLVHTPSCKPEWLVHTPSCKPEWANSSSEH